MKTPDPGESGVCAKNLYRIGLPDLNSLEKRPNHGKAGRGQPK